MNMDRVRSGVLLAVFFLGSLFLLPGPIAMVVLMAAGALAMLEFYALLDSVGIPHFKKLGVSLGLFLMFGTWLGLQLPPENAVRYDVRGVLLFLVVAAILLRQMFTRKNQRPWDAMASTFLGVMSIGFLLNYFTKLLFTFGDSEGRFLVFLLIVVVKMTDIGAYVVGCGFGRTKLIPKVSPAKTWEGCAGGVASGLIGAVLVYMFFYQKWGSLDIGLYDIILLAPLLSVFGIIGDLAESLLKRSAGVKDSGSWIQGMGGFLDVLDSLLFTAPILYIYTRLFMDIIP